MKRLIWITVATMVAAFAWTGCAGSSGDDCTGVGMEMCGEECVNTANNKDHCGGCNTGCGGDATCTDSVCSCTGTLEYCSSECVNTDNDNDHCGGCLAPCSGELQCRGGGCITPFDESCDGEDNDFDGHTDEDTAGLPLTRTCDNLCGEGIETCTGGVYTDCTAPQPDTEVCNGEDDDCDGLTDEDVTNTYYEDYDLDGYGDPDLAWATEACTLPTDPTPNDGVWVTDNTDCDDVDEFTYPGAEELCDGWDNDCDDDVDEGCTCTPDGGVRACGTDVGECVAGTQTCSATTGWGECGGSGFVPPTLGEICNGLDDDCDEEIDEELAADLYESNDTCALARALPDVVEGSGWLTISDVSLYKGTGTAQDIDWYTVHANEATHLECFFHPGEEQCDFQFVARLTVPSHEVKDDYVMCVYSGGTCSNPSYTFCTDAGFALYDQATHSYEMVLSWDGICGLDDDWDFVVEILYADQTPTACDPYELEFALLYDGDIAESCD